MKRQGAALWIMAICILALFTLATVMAPGPLNSLQSSNDSGGSNNNGAAADYNAPVVTSSTGDLTEGKASSMTLKATPVNEQTNSGGSWAWLFKFEGVSDQSDQFIIGYDGGTVAWFSDGSGSIMGLGARFSQGPGAKTVDAVTNISVSIGIPGGYTLKAWIVKADNLITLDPTGLEARSAELTTDLTVKEKPAPVPAAISISQTLAQASKSVVVGSEITIVLTDTAEAKGKWTGNITDQIVVEKSRISRTDVTGTWTSGSASGTVSWSDRGDYLIGSLNTVNAFKGEEDSESAEWTTTIKLTFRSTGEYLIQSKAINVKNSVDVSSGASVTIEVNRGGSSETENATPTTDTSTNTTAPAAPTTNPVVTPTTAPETSTAPSGGTGTPVANGSVNNTTG